ncbi:hypothetical protein [Williamsia sterculiae]|uniref:hypothetical protein n=1 Tax=Williamsia sterculiae TaxID=1344003 RepID=UPI00135667EA|nr:hypothetical protein [Williamsia sterculiae]
MGIWVVVGLVAWMAFSLIAALVMGRVLNARDTRDRPGDDAEMSAEHQVVDPERLLG